MACVGNVIPARAAAPRAGLARNLLASLSILLIVMAALVTTY